MERLRYHAILSPLFLTLALAVPSAAENEGQSDLDEATQLKITAESMPDLNKVVDLLDSALEKGLDEENEEFAEQLLVATLNQRARALSAAILNRETSDLRQNARWIQWRQFALTDLQRALEFDPGQLEAHLLIGKLQTLPLGDPNAARRAFGKVAEAEEVPDDKRAEALALRGAVQTDTDKRLADFKRAIELDSTSPEYLRLRAQHYYSEDQFEKALADIDQALQLDPDHAATHELRGRTLVGLDRLDEGLESFDRATELAPDALLPYQDRGQLYVKQGDLEKAIEQFTQALEISPDNWATLLIRAGVQYQAENVDAALADINEVIRIKPELLKAYQMKAEILATDDRLDEAIGVLERCIQAANDRPELIEVQYQLANYYLLGSRGKRAVDAYSKVLEWDANNAQALRGRGDAYLQVGKHAEAIADFEKALEVDNENQGVLNNLAWVLATSPIEEHRDGKRAIELATKACELTAYKTPHILSTLAAGYAEEGDFESAIKYSEQAVELGKDDEQSEQLAAELASYKEGRPWRELQSELQSNEPPDQSDQTGKSTAKPLETDQTFAPPSAPRAPARTADF